MAALIKEKSVDVFGRGTGKAHPVDLHVGKRLHDLRRFKGISQTDLAKKLSLTFQQIQKYEKGHNRLSASRLYEAAEFMQVPVDYFFRGISKDTSTADLIADPLSCNESIDLIRCYWQLNEKVRGAVRGLVTVLAEK
jgi:transcriptional regulator with XRE-family HTH domain